MKRSDIYHLYRRAGFGILPKEAEKLVELSREEVVDKLIEDSQDPVPLDIGLEEFASLFSKNSRPKLSQFRKLVLKTRERHLDLNAEWIQRMNSSEQELNERMTLFWANVFVCRDNVITFVQQYNNTLRRHALGNFKELVKAISREPAMMKYLNTNQNKRNAPNENFARELMELFTLGEGHYKEADIKEAARAFTGYNFRLDGSFRFVFRHHDHGEKNFFGWSGNFKGDDIVDIICNERRCARYICERLYRYFVNDKADKTRVEAMTAVFYPNYDIAQLMRYMLASDWFYEARNKGNKIKSPVDLLTSIHKIVPLDFEEKKQLLFVQRLLGQSLLQPPNVAGWGGGKEWVNSNTLMLRMKLPSVFIGEGVIPSSEPEYQFGRQYLNGHFKVAGNWQAFESRYGTLDREKLASIVCAPELNEGSKQLLRAYQEFSTKEYVIQLMSLPEFQLC